MSEVIELSFLIPESFVPTLHEYTGGGDEPAESTAPKSIDVSEPSGGSRQAHAADGAGASAMPVAPPKPITHRTEPAAKNEFVLGRDPAVDGPLVWEVITLAGETTPIETLGRLTRYIYDSLKKESRRSTFDIVVKLPNGTRLELHGTSDKQISDFGKVVAGSQRRRRR